MILIDGNDKKLFKDISVISNGKDPYSLKGDSGYFIEYFLGKINNEYTLAVIDTIEKYTNLSKLLNPILWHKDFSTFKEYLKLKSICLELFKENNINNNDSIEKQIESMKKEINGEGKEIQDKKIEDKKSNEKDGVKREENEKIDILFNDIWKKRKNIKIVKEKETPSSNEDEKKKGINSKRKLFFAEFTHGFYRK